MTDHVIAIGRIDESPVVVGHGHDFVNEGASLLLMEVGTVDR